MKRVLVVGDLIIDQYVFGHATRLCPEGPVPVIVPTKYEDRTGGAGLVAQQLETLIGREHVNFLNGSTSKKQRIFADDRLICRVDKDQEIHTSNVALAENWAYRGVIPMLHRTDKFRCDLLIISDYGKGAFTEESAKMILAAAKVPVLVDAKNNFHWYRGAFAAFPNETEMIGIGIWTSNIIRKLGARGCSVNGQIVPLETEHPVRDTTGAGDIFLAAFAAKFLSTDDLVECAKFANRVAARSVEFVGTHVVTDIRLEEM